MEGPALPLLLTSSQRRHLEISLGQVIVELEEAVVWFKRWPLPDRWQEGTLRSIEAAEARVRAVASRLGLTPAPMLPDPHQKLQSLASHWWSTALDCRSEVLRGYGALHPATAPVLDPLVEEVAAVLLELGQLTESGGAHLAVEPREKENPGVAPGTEFPRKLPEG